MIEKSSLSKIVVDKIYFLVYNIHNKYIDLQGTKR